MNIPAGSTWALEILVAAQTQDVISGTRDVAGFRIRGVIRNVSGTTTMHGASGEAMHRSDPSWNTWAVPDDANDALTIVVQGGSTTARWVATVRTCEVMFPAL